MAPLYDVMNGEIYEGVTRNLAMKIAGKNGGRYIGARHWDGFAEDNVLSATQVKRRVAALSQAVLDALPGVVAEMNAVKKSRRTSRSRINRQHLPQHAVEPQERCQRRAGGRREGDSRRSTFRILVILFLMPFSQFEGPYLGSRSTTG